MLLTTLAAVLNGIAKLSLLLGALTAAAVCGASAMEDDQRMAGLLCVMALLLGMAAICL